ncbi:MAG: hypothetical protein M3Y57_21985 [Acidobacteriota bacterium]|nr:hypothetical protein [Acidobacteriota bacterium]
MNYTTGKGVSEELRDAPEMCVASRRKTITLDEMRVLAWLRLYAPQIVSTESKFNVDRRAIAGAIAWEALENVKHGTGLWPGPGKVHASGITKLFGRAVPNPMKTSVAEQTEKAGYLPVRKGIVDRYKVLKNPTASIAYIAAIMRAGSDIAEENGFVVNNDPVVLTEFYQGWDLDRWRAHLKSKTPGTSLVGADTMAVWVSKNLDYLEDAVGKPTVKLQCSDTRMRPRLTIPAVRKR